MEIHIIQYILIIIIIEYLVDIVVMLKIGTFVFKNNLKTISIFFKLFIMLSYLKLK